jgi:hypothetical protein
MGDAECFARSMCVENGDYIKTECAVAGQEEQDYLPGVEWLDSESAACVALTQMRREGTVRAVPIGCGGNGVIRSCTLCCITSAEQVMAEVGGSLQPPIRYHDDLSAICVSPMFGVVRDKEECVVLCWGCTQDQGRVQCWREGGSTRTRGQHSKISVQTTSGHDTLHLDLPQVWHVFSLKALYLKTTYIQTTPSTQDDSIDQLKHIKDTGRMTAGDSGCDSTSRIPGYRVKQA